MFQAILKTIQVKRSWLLNIKLGTVIENERMNPGFFMAQAPLEALQKVLMRDAYASSSE
jgi:hypothetical protein